MDGVIDGAKQLRVAWLTAAAQQQQQPVSSRCVVDTGQLIRAVRRIISGRRLIMTSATNLSATAVARPSDLRQMRRQ